MFLTRIEGILKQTLSWQTWALFNSYLIFIWVPLAETNLLVDFSKYLEGINPSYFHLLLEELLSKEEVMQQGHKNVTQEVEKVAMGGEVAIGTRAVNEARAGQPWGYIY